MAGDEVTDFQDLRDELEQQGFVVAYDDHTIYITWGATGQEVATFSWHAHPDTIRQELAEWRSRQTGT